MMHGVAAAAAAAAGSFMGLMLTARDKSSGSTLSDSAVRQHLRLAGSGCVLRVYMPYACIQGLQASVMRSLTCIQYEVEDDHDVFLAMTQAAASPALKLQTIGSDIQLSESVALRASGIDDSQSAWWSVRCWDLLTVPSVC
jgi:hypothetical protein